MVRIKVRPVYKDLPQGWHEVEVQSPWIYAFAVASSRGRAQEIAVKSWRTKLKAHRERIHAARGE